MLTQCLLVERYNADTIKSAYSLLSQKTAKDRIINYITDKKNIIAQSTP